MKKKLLKYDLACGNNKQEGFTGVDIIKKGTQADIEFDLNEYPWTFAKDNSVDEVYCSHYIEHIPHINSHDDGMFHFFDELYRILKPGALAKFVIPYYANVRAFQDPTHHRFISETSFLYFSKAWRKNNHLEHYPVSCNFNIETIDHAVTDELKGKSQEATMYAFTHYWNIVNDIRVTIKKI